MNRLLTVLILSSFVYLNTIAQTSPTITINTTRVVEGIDPWNGDLCINTGYPSQGSINFEVNDLEDIPSELTVTATSSNPLVVPINVQHLRITYDFDSGEGILFINPIDEGQSTIILSVTDSDWNSTSYYIELTVKGCTDIIQIGQNDLDALPVNQTFTFQASDQILTLTGANAPMIASNEDIEFLAGNSVTLNAGFEVKCDRMGNAINCGEFLADIEACN